MTQSKITRVSAGFALVAAVLAALPLGVSARTMFTSEPQIEGDGSTVQVSTQQGPAKLASKGALPMPACASQTWPDIEARCLSWTGEAQTGSLRTVRASGHTVGNTTILTRSVSSLAAQR